MSKEKIIGIQKLDFQWQTEDPFLITMYHKDAYPLGNEQQGPNVAHWRAEDWERILHFVTASGCIMEKQYRDFLYILIEALKPLQSSLEGIVDHFDSKWFCRPLRQWRCTMAYNWQRLSAYRNVPFSSPGQGKPFGAFPNMA